MITIFGKDVERILNVLNRIKDETSHQMHLLARESDHRLRMIKHGHNIFVNNEIPNAPHGHPSGVHIHDFWLQSMMYQTLTTHGRGFINKVSIEKTWPEDHNEDLHFDHLHKEPDIVWEKEHPEPAAPYVDPIVGLGAEMWEDGERMQHIDKENYTDVKKFNTDYGSPWSEIYMLKDKIDELEQYAADYPQLQWRGEKHSILHLMHIVLSYTIDAKWAILYYHDYIQRGYDHEYNENEPSIYWDDFVNKKTIGNINQKIEERVSITKPIMDNLEIPSFREFTDGIGSNLGEHLSKYRNLLRPPF